MKGKRLVWIFSLSLCALKLNKLPMVTAGIGVEESFCILRKPRFQLDYRGSREVGKKVQIALRLLSMSMDMYQPYSRAMRISMVKY